MAGLVRLVPAIHVFEVSRKAWMPRSSPGMTSECEQSTTQLRPNPQSG